jgi:hypothetical protein
MGGEAHHVRPEKLDATFSRSRYGDDGGDSGACRLRYVSFSILANPGRPIVDTGAWIRVEETVVSIEALRNNCGIEVVRDLVDAKIDGRAHMGI